MRFATKIYFLKSHNLFFPATPKVLTNGWKSHCHPIKFIYRGNFLAALAKRMNCR